MKRPALPNTQVVILRVAFRTRKVLGTFEKRGADEQELANVTAFLQTDLFLLHLFFCKRKAVPVQWRKVDSI